MREYHLAAGFGTFLTAAALVAVTVIHFEPRVAAGPNLADMEAIEASLAYKKTSKTRQPQKQFRAPVPEDKPEGVSRDDTKAPVEPDKDEPKPKPDEDFDKLYDKFKRDSDEDLPVGKPDQDEGAEDGSEKGRGEVSTGDPFYQQLYADLDWSYPAILKGQGVPLGCLKLQPDGTITRVWLEEKSADAELNDSAERALETLKKMRNDAPQPVPAHLLRAIAERTCLRFKLD